MITVDKEYLKTIAKVRDEESHKGDFGHLLVVGGCQSMPGAALLATGAALKSGCGLVSLHSTSRTLSAAAISLPSAMLSEDGGDVFSRVPENLGKYSAIAVGPGLGRAELTAEALSAMMAEAKEKHIPMVLDADALNIISEHREMFGLIPEGSVMTPHPGELRRLVPSCDRLRTSFADDKEMDAAASELCRISGCTIAAKAHRTVIYSYKPGKEEIIWAVNTTGNAGMAKGGSGDVLTGLIGGLIARGYEAFDAAALGVWIHGYAGDCLTGIFTAESYSSKDLIDYLYKGFLEIYR